MNKIIKFINNIKTKNQPFRPIVLTTRNSPTKVR